MNGWHHWQIPKTNSFLKRHLVYRIDEYLTVKQHNKLKREKIQFQMCVWAKSRNTLYCMEATKITNVILVANHLLRQLWFGWLHDSSRWVPFFEIFIIDFSLWGKQCMPKWTFSWVLAHCAAPLFHSRLFCCYMSQCHYF